MSEEDNTTYSSFEKAAKRFAKEYGLEENLLKEEMADFILKRIDFPLREYVEKVRISDKKAVIFCPSATARHRLSYEKHELLLAIEEEFGKGALKGIDFR